MGLHEVREALAEEAHGGHGVGRRGDAHPIEGEHVGHLGQEGVQLALGPDAGDLDAAGGGRLLLQAQARLLVGRQAFEFLQLDGELVGPLGLGREELVARVQVGLEVLGLLFHGGALGLVPGRHVLQNVQPDPCSQPPARS